jgi:hypothetical protein
MLNADSCITTSLQPWCDLEMIGVIERRLNKCGVTILTKRQLHQPISSELKVTERIRHWEEMKNAFDVLFRIYY